MSFDPLPKQALTVEGTAYQFAEHPVAPGIAYGQEGRAAIVYKLESAHQPHALKVFKSRFRVPTLASLAGKLAPYASLPGLTVCRRSVLTPERHTALLRQFPDLTYSVLMPWIEGPTWMQVVQEQQAITAEQSLHLAQSFARILSGMEQRGVAHCDLSGANLILPALSEDKNARSYATVELVDVEQLFAPGLDHPGAVPSGSAGYAHLTIREGAWENAADRYAGAVLLAEMLGWCIPQVREAAWGESFFDPAEMQRQSRRFDLLNRALEVYWGSSVAQLFERAWTSELLADCPTLGEWLVAIPDSVPAAQPEAKAAPSIAPSIQQPPPVPPKPAQPSLEDKQIDPVREPAGRRETPHENQERVSYELDEQPVKPVPTPPARQENPVSAVEMLKRPASKPGALPGEEPARKKKKVLLRVILGGVVGCLLLASLLYLYQNGDNLFAASPASPAVTAVVGTSTTPTERVEALPVKIDETIDAPAQFNTRNTIGNFKLLNVLPLSPNDGWNGVFSPDGRYLAVGAYGQNAILWRMGDMALERTFDNGGRPDLFMKLANEQLALYTDPSPDATGYYGWDTEHNWEKIYLDKNSRPVAVSYDYMFYAQQDRPCGMINVFLFYSPAGETPKPRYSVNVPVGSSSSSKCDVRFSPDGKYLAVSKVSEAIIYLAENGSQVQKIEVSGSSNLAFSPNGQHIAAGGYIYSASDLSQLASLPGNEAITQVAYSPDGTLLAAGTTEGKVLFWDTRDTRSLKLVHSLQTQDTHPVSSLAFSPDGTKILVAAGQVYVYGYTSAIEYVDEYISPQNWTYMAPLDPKGGAQASIAAEPGKLTFSVPDGGRDLNPKTNLNAPTLLTQVSGDFTLETKVKPQFQGSGKQAAGLLVKVNESTFYTVSLSADGICTGGFINKVSISVINSGESLCQTPPADYLYLKIVRIGKEFSAYYAGENGIWQKSWTQEILSAADPLQVGIFLINQVDAPFSAAFDYMRVR